MIFIPLSYSKKPTISIPKARRRDGGESKNIRYASSTVEIIRNVSALEFLYGKYLFCAKL